MTNPKIGFLLSHPIQYFSPLMKKMNKKFGNNFKVYYCSDHGITEKYDTGFGKIIKWDIPLLDGYRYEFLVNNSITPSVSKFAGLINLDLIKVLTKSDVDILIVHGWGFFSTVFSILVCNLAGIKVWLRSETPLNQELLRSKKAILFRKLFLQFVLFKMVDKFLYIGTENKKFYRFYGAKEKQLIFTPYCVDNDIFVQNSNENSSKKDLIKTSLSVNENGIVILFCGKYIPKKRPLDVLNSFKHLSARFPDLQLIMVGEGELRTKMEKYISVNNLTNVLLTGFINQTEIAKYYSISDIFVLSSESGETWGLVTNEAMNFGLPVVVSHLSGCSSDLVIDGENGFVYETGNISQLTTCLEKLIGDSDFRKSAGIKSKEIISKFSNDIIVQNISESLLN